MNKVYKAQSLQMQSLIGAGIDLVNKYVSESRFEHSLRVAQTAVILCQRYNQDEDKGYYSGLMHDVCKEMNNETLLELAAKDGGSISALEHEKPALLHGRAAAVYLQTKLLVTDEQILEAVRHHTFGHVSMCDLAKIIYIADKIEPGRPYNTKKYYDALSSQSLNGITAYVARDNIEVLEKKGRKVSSLSQAFLLSVQE